MAVVTEQARGLLAQRQQLAHQRAVVLRRWAQFTGPRDVGGVEGLAQAAVARVLHHRPIDRVVQRQLVALVAVGARGFGAGLQHVGGHTVELAAVGVGG